MLDANVIVTPADVELCKIAGALQLVNEFGDQGQGSSILDGDVI